MRGTGLAVFIARGAAACTGFAVSLIYCMGRLLRRSLGAPWPNEAIVRDTARVMARLMCPPAGIRVHVVGAEHLLGAQPCVYVANHQSYLDYPILATIFPARTVLVGKAEMGRIPLVGWLFRRTGNVLLTRADARRAADTLAALAQRIGRERTSVWMFPEGTRRRTQDVPMLPFRSGAFRLAAAASVPVVPVIVSALHPRIDLARRRVEPTTIEIRILPAHAIGPNDDPRAAANAVRASMIEAFGLASANAERIRVAARSSS